MLNEQPDNKKWDKVLGFSDLENIDNIVCYLTIAPIFLAWPTAARPATPPPITRTFAGGTFPEHWFNVNYRVSHERGQ